MILTLAICLAACSPAAEKSATVASETTQTTQQTTGAAGNPTAVDPATPTTAAKEEVTPASAASASEADGADRSIKLADGTSVTLKALRLSGLKPGIGKVCAVEIDKVTIQTLGSGESEAYECRKLVEAGALPAKAGVQRIGLIYDTGSPNADFRTAIILLRTGTAWSVDEASVGTYDDVPAAKSIAALAKAVK